MRTEQEIREEIDTHLTFAEAMVLNSLQLANVEGAVITMYWALNEDEKVETDQRLNALRERVEEVYHAEGGTADLTRDEE